MQAIFDGVRAGVIAALILTLWCFVAVSGAMSGAAGQTGMAFVATAFGLLGIPQIIYGGALGVIIALWTVVLRRLELLPVGKALADGGRDRQVAATLLTLPVVVGGISAGVMVAHLFVTSGFNRATFQAQGLALVAAGLTVAMALIFPVIYAAFSGAIKRAPIGKNGGFWTWLVLGVYGVGALGVMALGYIYASGLHVWSATQMQMSLAFMVLVPLLTAAMVKWRWQRGAWSFGVPIAGLLIASACFAAAPGWVQSSAEMRAVTFRDAPVVSTLARQFIDLGERSEQIFAFADCDEDDDECLFEETVLPVTSPDHPARRAVMLALAAGDRAQIDEFESIPDPPKNILLIMIDTLRQDHLGFAGYHRNTSPNIDALVDDGVAFMNAYSTSPHTPRSLPPLFFGRYASNLRWYGAQYNFPRVRPENLSVFEVLQERGWRNIGMASHFYFDERRNVHQGFDVWDNSEATSLADSHTDIATPRIWAKVEPVLEELGQARRVANEAGEEAQPFSLFVHFFDPHARWNFHEEFPFDRGSTTRERHIAHYNSEIAFVDSYVGRIVERLKAEDLYDDTIIVITSDHGEAFNEHGHYFHGQALYNTQINVPMIIRVPGWYPQQIEGPVSIIDVAPTLLDLVGVTIPTEFEGESLVSAMLGRREVPRRPIFAELLPYTAFPEHHRAVMYGTEKLMVNFTYDIEEFYDLAVDPEEQNNLISEFPERAARLREMLDAFME